MTIHSKIAGHIRQAKSVTIVTGAGASKAAGIPLAGELIAMVTKDYGHCLSSLSKEDRNNYGRVMWCLSPADREALILPLLEKSGVNWGQIALALMLQEKYVARVLTFNFDLVLEKAAALLGLQLPVYDFGAAPTKDMNRIAKSAIVHLHGQSHGLVLLNTDDETQDHKENLRPILGEALREHLTIVIGYSGEADAAFEVMEDEYNSRNNLLWIGFDDATPKHLQGLMAKDYANYYGGCDFDLTMIGIAKELGIWPPKIVSNPMSHLLEELHEVKDYPVYEGTEQDLLTETREQLKKHEQAWDHGKTPDAVVFERLIGGKGPGDGPEVSKEALSDAGKTAQAWSRITEGSALADQAKTLTGSAAQDKYAAAIETYRAAVAIKPDMHEALYNWGNALVRQSKLLTGSAAQGKLAAAIEKYRAAVAIKPDKHEALSNWGATLVGQAKILTGSAAQDKYAAAIEKYRAAVAIKPDKHEALSNWGAALSDQAKTLTGSAAQDKYTAAIEKYRAAVAIKPDKHEALSNWIIALLHQAISLSGDAARDKIEQAKDFSLRVQKITGKADYNLACCYARLGEDVEAIAQLEACLADGTLPDRAHLEADSDMDGIRELAGFKAVLDQMAKSDD